MTDETLQIKDLTVERGGRSVLHGVTMEVGPGEITALLGANGAGKSTLVLTVAGVLPARSGSVTLGATKLLGRAPHDVRRHGVAVVAEGHPVLAHLSVHDNLRAAALALPRAEAEREVAAALDVFPELKERLSVGAHILSGGQKQMVNIAQALIARPRFLLIDELSFGLAPTIVVRLGDVIRRIVQNGVGVLLIEQFTTLALQLSRRAYVMERGDLAFEGSSAELARHPEVLHNAYLAAGAKSLVGGASTAS